MIPRRLRLLILVAALMLVSLAACQHQEAATPQPTTAPGGETAAGSEPVLTVLGQPFTMQDLNALEQATAVQDDRTATGVSLLALLEAAGVTAGDVALVAGDGYAANVSLADIDATAVLGYGEGGSLDAMLPGLPRSTWVRGVTEIREAKSAEPVQEGEPKGEVELLDQPLALTDAAGRTVTLEALPQRILVVGRGPHMTLHVLYMFEEGRERLIGSESRSATPSDFLPVVDPRFNDIQTLDANPNVEQIAALAPDLVIMKGITEDATATALAEIDIPVLYVDLETVDAFYRDVANLGAVLGNPARAQEIIAYYQSRIDLLAERTAGLAEEDKPQVLLISYSDRGGEVAVEVPAAAWMQTAEVKHAGGHPVWLDSAAPTDGWTVVNLEQIAQWDPEAIFVVISYRTDPQEVIDGLKADASWAALQAVRNDALYAFPQDIFGWDQPEPRWILGMQWLAAKMYPDLFGDIDMNAEVMSYFGDLYGMDTASIQEHILPVLQMDVH